MFVIDCHAHFVPQGFPECPVGVPPKEWPIMVQLDDGRARMVIDDKEFRVFEPAYWDVGRRIRYMDDEGIGVQVFSPLPELLGYWFQARTAEAMASYVNHAIATAAAEAPGRLVGLGTLPLQDVDMSVALVAEIAELGLRGVLVASNVNGVSIADPRFYPVFAALERQELALFVHGYRPAGVERFVGSPLLPAIAGVPQDTSAAIASFIMTDILGSFPKLRVGFAHGGGGFGAVLPRMDHVWHEFAELQQHLKVAPRDYVRKFFFDTITFGASYLRYLVEVFGSETLMAGSDGPTPIGQRGLQAFVKEATGDTEVIEAILCRNAIRFFGLESIAAQFEGIV